MALRALGGQLSNATKTKAGQSRVAVQFLDIRGFEPRSTADSFCGATCGPPARSETGAPTVLIRASIIRSCKVVIQRASSLKPTLDCSCSHVFALDNGSSLASTGADRRAT